MPKLRQRVSKLKDGEGAYVQIPEVVGGVSVETISASMVGKLGVAMTGMLASASPWKYEKR